MNQWGFYFDQTRCINCQTCTMACQNWNDDKRGDAHVDVSLGWIETGKYDNPDEYEYVEGSDGTQNFEEYRKYHMKERWIRLETTEYGTGHNPDVPGLFTTGVFASDVDVQSVIIPCLHCDDPPCVAACPVNIIVKDAETGIVSVTDRGLCISVTCNTACRTACTWDAPQFYDDPAVGYTEGDFDQPKMTKCDLCIDRIKEGLKTACAAACMNRCIDVAPMVELIARYPGAVAHTAIPEFADDAESGPNILFKKRTPRVL